MIRRLQALASESPIPYAGELAAVVGLGLAFQIGHFLEHAVQFGV